MTRVLIAGGDAEGRRELAALVARVPAARGVATTDDARGLPGQVARALEQRRPFALALLLVDGDPREAMGVLDQLWSLDPDVLAVACADAGGALGELGELGLEPERVERLLLLPRPFDPAAVAQLVRAAGARRRRARRERRRARGLERALAERTRELRRVDRRLRSQAREYRRAIEASEQSARSLQESFARLERAHDLAQAATHAKTEFLANMSHEIRTPMTAILGYADLLRDPDLSRGDHHTYLNVIRRNGDHLLALIDDILDLSKIEAGRMTVEQVECAPADILDDVASLMRVRARKKRLTFDIRYEGPIPETVVTDPTRVRQVLLNLVSNAIKFTISGGVELTCRLAPEGASRLELAVRDTGIGLTPLDRETLFEAFSQADNSTTRHFGGTGLGLAISRRLARMLGGDIQVESQRGSGSTFTLSIATGDLEGVALVAAPRAARPALDAREDEERPAGGASGALACRVLLAEDGRDNQLLISRYLRKAGAEVSVAGDGTAALERALEADPPFDLILMDMQMPRMDGYEVTARLRELGWRGPIAALTAHAMPGDREKCLAAGCDEYMTKPVDRRRLIELCARLAGPGAPLPADRGRRARSAEAGSEHPDR